MDRTRREKIQDFLLNIIRYIAIVWMRYEAKTEITCNDGFDFNRTEPYVLLANHAFMFDVIHVQKHLKVIPYTVANEALFAKQPTKFLFNRLLHGIPKSKGASDLRTAKMLFKTVKRGYPICIFPEGDTTFFGETNYIEESTFKLIKKMKIDVVTCTFRGGYLMRPRWAKVRRKNRIVHMDYNIPIKKDDIKSLSVEEIKDILTKSLYNNDYEYQREVMIKRPSKRNADGFEDVVYICPECEAVNSIETHKHEVRCTSCNTVGSINDYGFIEGFKYDSLVDWDNFQKPLAHKLLDSEFQSTGVLYYAEYGTKNKRRNRQGKVTIKYRNHAFIIKGAVNILVPFEEIKNPIVTLRRILNFTYKDRGFIVKLDSKAIAFLRVVQEKY